MAGRHTIYIWTHLVLFLASSTCLALADDKVRELEDAVRNQRDKIQRVQDGIEEHKSRVRDSRDKEINLLGQLEKIDPGFDHQKQFPASHLQCRRE